MYIHINSKLSMGLSFKTRATARICGTSQTKLAREKDKQDIIISKGAKAASFLIPG